MKINELCDCGGSDSRHERPRTVGEHAVTAVKPGRYRHYKGNEYTVLGVAKHSETLEEMVVYRAEYGERGLWVRPAEMFAETVTVNGIEMPRFAYIGEAGE